MANSCTCCTPSPSPSPAPPPWREVHGYHPVPSSHIEHYCFWHSVTSIVLLTLYIATILWMRRNRTHMPNDSVFLLHSWPRMVRVMLPLIFVLVFMVPLALFIYGHLSAIILSLSEKWPYLDTFEYILCNMVALPPMNSLTPTTVFGSVVDVTFAVLETVFSSTIIGLCAGMAWVNEMQELLPQTYFGLIFSIVLISVVYVAIAVICSFVLTLLEGEPLWQCFRFTISIMCGIGNPLTPWVPQSDRGNFFAALCSVLQLAIGGAIVGVLGGHAKMNELIVFLEGEHVVEAESALQVPDQGLHIGDSEFQNKNLQIEEKTHPLQEENERLNKMLQDTHEQHLLEINDLTRRIEVKLAQSSSGDTHEDSESQSKIMLIEETNSRLDIENQRLNKMLLDIHEQHRLEIDELMNHTKVQLAQPSFDNMHADSESQRKTLEMEETISKLTEENQQLNKLLQNIQEQHRSEIDDLTRRIKVHQASVDYLGRQSQSPAARVEYGSPSRTVELEKTKSTDRNDVEHLIKTTHTLKEQHGKRLRDMPKNEVGEGYPCCVGRRKS